MTTRLVAVNAGLGDPSSTRLLVDRLVESAREILDDRSQTVDVEVVDLRDLAVGIAQSLVSGFADAEVRRALEKVYAADGLIVATPVFNASYSGLFKSFVDLVEVDRMAGKPVLIAATGGSPRHSMVLDHAIRPLFGYLRAIVVPTGVYAAAEDWAGTSGDTAALSDRVHRAAAELVALLPLVNGDSDRSVTRSVTARFGSDDYATATEAAGIATFAKLLGESA
ncbi:CE1759 family FMN reductase [Gordonia sp. CPCC 205515]|uniref:CE1759 family FMN reductase n=1 Tax=Gordonia sp. CPCC 205515 TaxID=3140791 RepID=UPI003AF402B7